MNNTALIVGGVAVLGGLAFFLYTKNKKEAGMLPAASAYPGGGNVSPGGSTPSPSYTAPVPTVQQTMWKDRDGNIFQLTTDKQRWGYVIKVNGSIQGKNNQMETMFLGPDGYMIGADNNGSVFVYKNGGWQNVIRDNKTSAGQYLIDHGQPNVYAAMNGLGSAFCMN